jgi:hypothetical protein
MNVSILNLNKAMVLMALYNASQMQGNSFLGGSGSKMSLEQAESHLKERTYFDYLNGKVMKVGFEGDVINLWLYDRDNGLGAGLKAIKSVYPQAKEIKDEVKSNVAEENSSNVTESNSEKTSESTPEENKPLSVREKKISYRAEESLKHFKSYGVPLVHTKSNKKQKKVSIEYGKGYFCINGEKRYEVKTK